MKKNLLITMGCSLTEGVGCYDDTMISGSGLTRYNKNTFPSLYLDIFEKSKNMFHKCGWPNHVGKGLGYDEVINLGRGGSSTSGQVKAFVEKYLDFDFTDYNVNIIWKLTDPSRFSFYTKGSIKDIGPSFSNEPIGYEYINFVNNLELDTILEQIFYIKLMNEVCNSKRYNLVLSHISGISFDYLTKFYKTDLYITNHLDNIMPDFDNNNSYVSPICNHPSKIGYSIIAKNMITEIKKNHPHFVVGTPKNEIKWKWDGDVNSYKSII